MKQIVDEKTDARLVAGVDEFNHFNLKDSPKGTMDASDVAGVKRNILIKEKFMMPGANM